MRSGSGGMLSPGLMNAAQDLGSQDGRNLIVARQSPIDSEAAQPRHGARDGLARLERSVSLHRRQSAMSADIIIVLMT